jgi:mono/diheme cytochrome c family protein
MISTISLVVGALSTDHKIGLVTVAALFVGFALVSSLVLPRRSPDFPGKHLNLFIVVCVLFFLAMVAAVIVFGREPNASAERLPPVTTTTTTTAPVTTTAPATTSTAVTTTAPTTTSGAAQGDPVAGKAVFASAGCGGCHTLKAANASGAVGPNLDSLKPAYDTVVHQVETGGGVMPAFKDQLTQKQIDDVAAFVYSSTHS